MHSLLLKKKKILQCTCILQSPTSSNQINHARNCWDKKRSIDYGGYEHEQVSINHEHPQEREEQE